MTQTELPCASIYKGLSCQTAPRDALTLKGFSALCQTATTARIRLAGRPRLGAPTTLRGCKGSAESQDRATGMLGMSGLAADVASLSHSRQITSALWKLSGFADTMLRIPPGPLQCYK
jgi:hypothetical protein